MTDDDHPTAARPAVDGRAGAPAPRGADSSAAAGSEGRAADGRPSERPTYDAPAKAVLADASPPHGVPVDRDDRDPSTSFEDEQPGDGDGGDGDAVPARRRPEKSGSFLSELPFLVGIALVLAMLIKAFVVAAFYIPSGSMEETLQIRDRVLANKLMYDLRDIRRGEIVVFDGLDSFTPETVIPEPANGLQRVVRAVSGAVGLGAPGEKDFIKRVIGLPGDRVACCTNGHVTVTPAGTTTPVELEEPYVFEDNRLPFCAAGTEAVACPDGAEGVLVPEGRIWVMGDHRSQSSDSRYYLGNADQGTIAQDRVIGRAFVIVWPVSRAKPLSVPHTFDGPLGALPAYGLVASPYALGLVGALPLVALRRRLRRHRR